MRFFLVAIHLQKCSVRLIGWLQKCMPVVWTMCLLNMPSVPPQFSSLTVRLGRVVVLSSKLWAEVTCVTFRQKYERADTWSSGYFFSCHGDWGGPELQMLPLQDVRLLASTWVPKWPCGIRHHHNSCWIRMGKKQTSVCYASYKDERWGYLVPAAHLSYPE